MSEWVNNVYPMVLILHFGPHRTIQIPSRRKLLKQLNAAKLYFPLPSLIVSISLKCSFNMLFSFLNILVDFKTLIYAIQMLCGLLHIYTQRDRK